ncbi:NAC domain-containing protein 68-like [Papaver somniferum]|uniref:NAC domain-containing protein 68-like n=1 Tax=Papaver somniferum TaxID=3469 RepID=UPI000E704508|nr:NAC domain-containing protein 68-like [Papaver somniferum]
MIHRKGTNMSSPGAKTNAMLNAVTDEMKLSGLPSGFTFMPKDEVLIVSYLAKKNLGEILPPNLMKEMPDFNSHHPKELMQNHTGYEPKKPTDWYFFTQKYHAEKDVVHRTAGANVASSTTRVRGRVPGQGFWLSKQPSSSINLSDSPNIIIGCKRTWDYYEERGSEQYETDYVMQEYTATMAAVGSGGYHSEEEKNKKDEFILCRIYDKKTRADEPSIF